jgi:uncharacterized protein
MVELCFINNPYSTKNNTMTALSKYSRIIKNIGEDVILYNSQNRAIVSLPETYFENNILTDMISDSELAAINELDFFDNDAVLAEIEQEYNKFTNLIISLETLLDCNLACPYCYQIGKKSTKKPVSKDNLDLLFDYIVRVYDETNFQSLTFKILGGEPSVGWKTADYIITKISIFCKSRNVYFKLMIDTNGTIIKDLSLLNGYDSLILTIPLTHQECHDAYRKYTTGKGSYEIIVKNINELSRCLNNTSIVLRYNVDSININKFSEYVYDLRGKLNFTPIISPNYTMNLGEGEFVNSLTHKDFIQWLSSDFIDILADNDLPIVVAPFNLTEKCQFWSKYSLKMFSNGSVGACAMSFFADENPTIREVLDDFDRTHSYWGNAKEYTIFSDQQCRNCASLFLCGGAYRLPCIKSLNLKECVPDGLVHVNLDLFLKRYIKYHYCPLKVGRLKIKQIWFT